MDRRAFRLRAPQGDRPGADLVVDKVLRGGSYLCHESYCNRYGSPPARTTLPTAPAATPVSAVPAPPERLGSTT
ncbi:hypothetical protein GCM10009533_06690 [Saccharopolyspora spinosporotrichia]|uniref:Uncharacterized protein n=1 Tax=Saccharopolyspora erythraea TaxID=1836 RepID=A0ABP3M265_SACER